MSDLLTDVTEAEGKIVGLAKAMPDAACDWRPSPDVRSTKEVFVHVTADNYFIPIGAGSTRRPTPASRGLQDRRGVREADSHAAAGDRRARDVVCLPEEGDGGGHGREAGHAFEVAEDVHPAALDCLDDTPARAPRAADCLRPQQQRHAAVEQRHRQAARVIRDVRANVCSRALTRGCGFPFPERASCYSPRWARGGVRTWAASSARNVSIVAP